METVKQADVFALIAEINAFADRAETLINNTRTAYDRNKKAMQTRHSSSVSQLEKSYKSNCDAISSKSKKTISDAQRMLADVDGLDARLSQVDKYYRKTKEKKVAELADKTSDRYQDVEDYFSILEQIKTDYTVISKKYSEDILPALINGLNYFFSSKRKKDYEDLIVLRNTLQSFVKEIESELPPLTTEELAQQKKSYFEKRDDLVARNKNELNTLEENYRATLDRIAGQIYEELDRVLPDALVDFLSNQISEYNKIRSKVNAGQTIELGILHMCFVEYPVDFFVQSAIVASLIKEKCATLLVDGSIRLPISITLKDAPAWMVVSDNSNSTALQAFTHSVMYGVLSACPVAKLTFSVVDPENRGNSIAPYFDAKKKLPELFAEQIIINRDDVLTKINQLNAKIEDILQDKLGTKYDTIYDYAADNSSYEVNSELLVLYDFPKGFDEQGLAGLRNILRNGSRCGIYTLISYSPANVNGRDEFVQSLKTIESLSVVIRQNSDTFVMRGMPLLYYTMPDKANFAKFFSKYMLIFEGIKNRGIAFSPLIKKLVDATTTEELCQHIMYIGQMMEDYLRDYSQVPEVGCGFPNSVTLGEVSYPSEIFSDSIGYDRIVKAFGSRDDKGNISSEHIDLPLSFDLHNSFNVFLHAPEETSMQIRTFTHHVMWSMLSFLPVTKINFCIMDSEGRGNSILPFLDFLKKMPDIFSTKVFTSQDLIYEKLQSINNQLDDFILNKLGTKYKDILEYNLHTPTRAEPITLLILYDFPAGMDGRCVDTLINILRNGNKCGVYTLICHNPGVTFSRYESIDDRLEQITKYCVSIDYKDNGYRLLPYNLPIKLPEMMDSNTSRKFVDAYFKAAEIIKNKGLAFSDILAPELYVADSAHVLDIPMGVGDEDAIVSLRLGEGTSHHGLIGGGTGGGKSTLLHTIIMSSMLHYSPDQLHLYLMDFKGGTEFKIYESERLPHIQLLALDAMQEFGESILQNLVEEMEHRSNEFKTAGGYTKVEDYVRGTGKPMPRILVIMDEFQILFDDTTNRKVAMRSANHAKRIVTEGRAYGVHLLMATQSTNIISSLALDRGTIEQMRIRIGLKCGEDDARYLFSDRYDRDAMDKMVGPKGTAVLNPDYTEQYGNTGLRVAYCDNESKVNYLKQISEQFASFPCKTQIFEGSRTEKLLHYLQSRNIQHTDVLPVRIHMGNTIKVADPFEIVVDRKRKHNLLVCGTNEKMANNVVNTYMVSAALNSHVSIYCIDGDTLVGDDVCGDFHRTLQKHCDLHIAESRADIVQFIHDIYEVYNARKKNNEKGIIFVVIKNLQFLDIVKSMLKGETVEESEYIDVDAPALADDSADEFNPFASALNFNIGRQSGSGDCSASNEKLLRLIEDGSGFGIHFIVSSLEYQTVKDCMHYGENALSKFPERIIFSLSDNDADNLVENVSVAGLRDNTVYFTDGVKDTYQMKPYVAPTPDELDLFLSGAK